jgi:enoyl-CoA hydratase/carnithine racemase
MLLLGEGVDAETAASWGLINQAVADADLMPTARALARRLAQLPPAAVQQTRALIRSGAPGLAARMAEEIAVFRERVLSPEAKEAFTAFAEKRKPDFTPFY